MMPLRSSWSTGLILRSSTKMGMTGIEAAREITSSSDTAVVMLTAFSQRELIHEARTQARWRIW